MGYCAMGYSPGGPTPHVQYAPRHLVEISTLHSAQSSWRLQQVLRDVLLSRRRAISAICLVDGILAKDFLGDDKMLATLRKWNEADFAGATCSCVSSAAPSVTSTCTCAASLDISMITESYE